MTPKYIGMSEAVSVGSVHGRFQPLHNSHFKYILEAKARCDFLWIGLTQYRIDKGLSGTNPLGRHRERPESNPLTYYERVCMIREALRDAGVGCADYGFVPFPIEDPDALPQFLPIEVVCYTTICEEWNREKIRVLRGAGYVVEVLWERTPKDICASDIREAIVAGDRSWEGSVPPATVRCVERFGLADRLRRS